MELGERNEDVNNSVKLKIFKLLHNSMSVLPTPFKKKTKKNKKKS